MEVPRLGVEMELQLLAYTTTTTMPDLSLHTAHGNARSLTHCMGARDQTHILMDTSEILNQLGYDINSLYFLVPSFCFILVFC